MKHKTQAFFHKLAYNLIQYCTTDQANIINNALTDYAEVLSIDALTSTDRFSFALRYTDPFPAMCFKTLADIFCPGGKFIEVILEPDGLTNSNLK